MTVSLVSPAATGKTAIQRTAPSVPLRTAMRKRILDGSVFDWGCGHGADIVALRNAGHVANGWDPNHEPFNQTLPGEWAAKATKAGWQYRTVLCTYVLNVLPKASQRIGVLEEIFAFLPLGGRLIVSTRPRIDVFAAASKGGWESYNDGFITSTGTFQKGIDGYEVIEMIRIATGHRMSAETISSNPTMVWATKQR